MADNNPMILRAMNKGKFVRVNDSFKAKVGFDATELAEKPFLDWIDQCDRAIVQAALENDERRFIARHTTRDGSTLQLEIQVAEHEEGLFVLGRCAKGTTQLESDKARYAEATVLGTLDAIARIIEEQNTGFKCSILLVAEGRFVFGAGPSLPEEYNSAVNGYAIGPNVGSCGTAIFWNTPVIVEDIQADPLWASLAELAKKAGVAACWSHPFTSSSGNVLGALALYSSEPCAPTTEQLSQLKAAARITGLAVERGRAEEELKRADEATKAARDLLQQVIDNAPIRVFWKDSDCRYLGCNPLFARDAGKQSPAELIDQDDFTMGWSAQAELYRADDQEVMRTGQARINFEEPQTTPDGKNIWLRTSKAPLYDRQGEVMGVLGLYDDITLQKREERRLALAMDASKSAIWEMDFTTGKLDYDSSALKVLGLYTPEAPDTLENWLERVHTDDRTQFTAMLEQALHPDDTRGFDCEYRFYDNAGGYHWLQSVGRVVHRDAVGQPLLAAGYSVNIDERKRAEEKKLLLEQQFQQTQKLESLGVLAGGIAHDFNNILAIIMGYCSLTKMNCEDADKHVPEIEKAAERAAALCNQMLAYAGKASLTQSLINTRTLVDEMLAMLKTTIQKNVVIKPELGTDIPFIMGDASQIRQVVMNLIINAAEAIGDAEGEILVSLAKTEFKAEQPEKDHLGFIIPAGRHICFEVSDNGCGMDDDTRRKIFEPFYSTKFTGRGLGMSAVLGIIKSHNGALKLESRLGDGTNFRVYLPVPLSEYEKEEAQQTTASAAWQGSGTILLVEDEMQVKAIATAQLQHLGFKVLDAANGKEALELYQQNVADITLVISDIGMPVMNGYDLFYKLKQLDPKLPIIISSGFGEVDIGSKIPREEIAGLINKPYRFDQLREVLSGVVEWVTPDNA
ncbi:MAG: PAS domain S-box protein [Geobacteraceae bacterium]|nr:PAS domain S-box protein [Geobacteraceae bacterium]NTW80883.1 PAS domain S-box protein [Geobacteraceae bacterium]